MNKLSKPKAFEASESIKTESGIEIANLLRSGIKNQTVILVGHNQKWHEIEIESLRIDDETFLENSHLESAAHYIDTNKISLSDMGIVEEAVQQSYDLEHDDFMGLSKMFPAYDYIQISKLHDYEKHNGLPNGVYHKKQTLKMLTDRGITINEYIREVEERKHAIINDPVDTERTIKSFQSDMLVIDTDKAFEDIANTYEEVVNTDKPQYAIIVDKLPEQEKIALPEDAVSISMFENLSPARITELTILKAEQEKIAAENPVVVITNKTTYAQAKKTKAILLSASTKIDGKTGVFANAKRFINTFKHAFDKEGEIIAAITRKPHDEQNKLITAWEDRAKIQAQNRVKELTSVPFVFNVESDTYTLGSLIVTQKDIEDLSDADWSKKIEQGKAIVIALEAVKSEQDSKIAALEKRNEELAAMLEKFLASQNPVQETTLNTPVINLISKEEAENGIISDNVFVTKNPFEPVTEIKTPDPEANYSVQEQVYNAVTKIDSEDTDNVFASVKEYSGYSLPHPDNKLLNELDLAHVSVLEEKQYIECREYYAQALQDAADAINDILVNPDKTIQKSVAITELIKTWKL